MKKQLIILLAAVSLITLAQSPQRFPGGVIGKYFQKSGSSADSVLLGNGQAKALSTIQANVDTVHKIATKYDLNSKQDTLPATPANPQSKFLNGNKQWSEIVVGSGGYAANMYPTAIASDISGYYKLSYTNEATQTIRSYTVTNQEVKVSTSIYDAGIGVTTIDAGIWLARMRMYVASASGNTRSRAEVFLRHTDGTETTLFSASSSDINNTSSDWVVSESNQPSFLCLTTDRLGIRHFISTDSHSAVTVYVVIGNGYASYINTPLALRHSQLRGLNDDPNYQHITSTQVSGLHTHSNKSALDMVSGTNTGDETLSTIKTKLGVASAANDGYLSRENWATFNGKQDALGYTPVNSAAVGAANGVAPLDASAKISTTYLPSVVLGAMKYQGTWDASTSAYPTSPSQGNYWVVSVAGTISSVAYKVGDWMAYNGTGWNKIDNQQTVSSVFGRTGAVTAVSGDYTTDQVTEGTNKYYTDTRARSAISLTTTGNSGASTYSSGVLNVPNYTLSGLGGQTQLNGTGFVKSSGTTISYDNTSYLPVNGGVSMTGLYSLSGDPTASLNPVTKQYLDRRNKIIALNLNKGYAPIDNFGNGSTFSVMKWNVGLAGWPYSRGLSVTLGERDTDDSDTGNLYPGSYHQIVFKEDGYNFQHRYARVGVQFNSLIVWSASKNVALNALYIPTSGNSNGFYYKCTTAGTTGTTEPAWPSSGTVTDGTVVWEYAGKLWSDWDVIWSSLSGNLSTYYNITAAKHITYGGTSSQFLKGDGSLDANTYLTGNQNITLSGDVIGSGKTSINATLANSGVTAGTYKSVTVDAKGRVTGGTNPTTLSGYGITDAAKTDGSNASGTWGINISGKSNGLYNGSTTDSYGGSLETSGVGSLLGVHTTTGIYKFTSGAIQTWLGLGSNAYTSTAYLPISGGTLSGSLTSPSITLTTGASANKVLTSDASGNASWQTNNGANETPNTYAMTSSFVLGFEGNVTSNSIIFVNSSSDITIQMPYSGWGSWWKTGQSIAVCRKGTGNVTFITNTGSTIASRSGYTKIKDQYGWVSVTYGPDDSTFYLAGNLGN